MKKILIWKLLLLQASMWTQAQKIILPPGGNENTQRNLWTGTATKTIPNAGKFTEIILDETEIKNIYDNKIPDLVLQIPDAKGNAINVELLLQKPEPIRIKTNNSEYRTDILPPLFYKGKAIGIKEKHDVMLTIGQGFISLQALLPNIQIAIGQENKSGPKKFLLYNSSEVRFPTAEPQCSLPPPLLANDAYNTESNKTTAASDKCIYVFVDCSDSLFLNRGRSIQNTVDYIYSIWNDVRTAFANEQLNVKISEINIWETPSPYKTPNRDTGLTTFARYYQNNYHGNMAMLMDWGTQPRAGIAGGFGWAKAFMPNVCGNYNAAANPYWNVGSFIYNDLNYFGNYQNFPVQDQQRQVYQTVHEIGHLLNSPHTHWCGWAGGPIDNCSAVESGPCAAGPTPTTGGTFMSYCLGAGQIINFNNGFGPLPGTRIRNFVANSACLNNCPACATNNTIGALTGYYDFEASNQITANGLLNGPSTYIKLDAGTKVSLQPGFRAAEGTKVKVIIDGCGGIR